MLEYLYIAFGVISCIQAFFYFTFLLFFPKNKQTDSFPNIEKPISVLICAKNEEENLKKNLPHFEHQDYPHFELVLINDNSTDKTLEVMESFKASSKIPVKIVNVLPSERFWGNKKYAITLGIKAASFEQLLFTDADCIPVSNKWITKMAFVTTPFKNIILGYGKYEKIKNSLLNKLIRFETLTTAIQYFSYANLGLPYMGVGRNLSYPKTIFFNAKGFMNHMHIKSGDDDLFINQVATRKNTQLQINPESFTESVPKKTWKSWIQQKRRHISTASSYKWKHKILLGLFHLSQAMFFILAALLIGLNYQFEIVFAIIGFRYFIFLTGYALSANRLKENDLILLAPFLELFLLFSQIYIFIFNLISKPKHW